MKLGYKLRPVFTHLTEIVRRLLDMFVYLLWILLDPSKYKIIDNKKIKNIIVVYLGAIGDTYNVLGIINKTLEKYPHLNFYYLTVKKNMNFIKNPKVHAVTLKEAKNIIDEGSIDAIIFLTNMPHKDIFDREFYFKILKVPYKVEAYSNRISTFFKQIPFPITRKVFPNYRETLRDQISAFEKLGFFFDRKITFYFIPEAEKYASDFFKKHKISKDEKIIFFHATNGKIKRAKEKGKSGAHMWPYKRWSKLADIILKKHNCKIVFTGTEDEKEIIAGVISNIKNKKKIIDTSGKLSLEQIASLLKRADLLVSLDTSLTHICAQTRTPVIVILGEDPVFNRCYPWTNKRIMLFHPEICNGCRRIICPEGDNICIKAVSIEEVVNAVDKFLLKR